MRGKELHVGIGLCGIRITPAYAGKRPAKWVKLALLRDHPRVCGEKMMKAGSNCAMLGLPPRMRGKVSSSPVAPMILGITPAYAGKSGTNCREKSSRKDHPRVCGEKIRAYVKIWNEWGSPPRMRGKATFSGRHRLAVGITPAYAGKRRNNSYAGQRTKDHPRVCGEKRIAFCVGFCV